jgi:hypothetical protein
MLLLGGAAAVSVGAALVLTPDAWRRKDSAAPSATLAFEGLAARLADARTIEVRKHDATLVLRRQGEAWVLPDRGNYPARPERVRELLVGLTELRLIEPRTADPGLHDRLGVDDPLREGSTGVLLRVLGAEDAPLAELVVGRRRVRTQGGVPETAYVRRPTEAQAWLAEGRLAVDADPQLWVDRDIANIARDRIRRVVIRRLGEAELVLDRGEAPEAKLQVQQPPDAPPTDEVALDEVARALEYLSFLDVTTEGEVPGTALGETRFELTDGMAVTVWPHKGTDTLWIRLRAEGGADAAELNARWQGWAYQVGEWKEKAFMPRLAELVPRTDEPAPIPAPPPASPQ